MQFLALIAILLLSIVPPQSTSQRVHDFANLLSPEQRQSLENLSREVDQKTTAEMVIVTVNSLDGQPVEKYAQELLQSWGIGKRKTNNGVLLLVAPKERRMSISTGYGIEPLLTDSLCGEIRDENVIPHFKRNDYAGGISAGAHRLADILMADPAGARGDPNSAPVLARAAGNNAKTAAIVVACAALALVLIAVVVAFSRFYATTSFALVTSIIAVLFAIAVYLFWRTPHMQRPFGWFGGAALASLAAWGFNLQRFRRYGPHSCSKCGTRLQLLSEQEEDAQLTPVQQLEEKIGSVNYDVWFCPACLNNDTERYIRAFSHFKECPQCKARTFKEDAQKIVTPATTFFSGVAEVEGRCVNCNYKTVRKIVLPMIVTSSGWTGSGSSGSGSFGGSFGGGGGGFSGGGGFGGGGGGGGGASGGW
jgi:uncharacterized protein